MAELARPKRKAPPATRAATAKDTAPKVAKRRGRPPLPRSGADEHMPDDIRGAVARLKRERIIASAVELFYRQGYERTTLEQVADAMAVTKPFIYAHFPSKADLLAEISSRAIRHAHDGLNRILLEEGTQTQRLERIFREFLLAVLDNQAHAVIYSREETELRQADRDAINGLRRAFDRKLVALLEAGTQAGEFSIEDIPLTAIAIGGLIGWAPVWYRSSGRLGKQEVAERLAGLVLNMVKASKTKTRRSKKDPA
jgi:TetR/AcrR family transcriptional regulator, cholesterol catabolism regulator